MSFWGDTSNKPLWLATSRKQIQLIVLLANNTGVNISG